MRKSSLFSILLFLLICVGCSTPQTPQLMVKTEVIKIYPPDELLSEPEEPNLVDVVITDDILTNSDAFKLAYRKAVSQIEKIRQWVKAAKVQ